LDNCFSRLKVDCFWPGSGFAKGNQQLTMVSRTIKPKISYLVRRELTLSARGSPPTFKGDQSIHDL